ncbi:MAG: acetylglutamate kinase [Deltaproteobacteria bacterium]|nr:acetylglutamate kinase [Deltaproteobacteria bacterium]
MAPDSASTYDFAIRSINDRSVELRGKTIVIKFGGELVDDAKLIASLAQDVLALSEIGVRLVLCHGGGPQISKELARSGVEPKFHRGQRITDEFTLLTTCRILRGEINAKIVSLINRAAPIAVGLSGVDGGLFEVDRADPALGWVGEVRSVRTGVVNALCDAGYIPVVASISAGHDAQLFNINADFAASALAGALQADQLMLFTNVEGLYRSFPDKASIIKSISASELSSLLPSLESGMVPKVQAALRALESGASKVRILDGRDPHAVVNSLSHDGAKGTIIERG